MTRRTAFAAAVPVLALALARPVSAQEAEPGVVVSEQICKFGSLDEINDMVREHWAPFLDAGVADGRLTGWGVLNHSWGSEWNWVIYYTGPDASTLTQTVSSLLGEIFSSMPGDPLDDFDGMCSAHRDNAYVLVMTQGAEAAGGQDD